MKSIRLVLGLSLALALGDHGLAQAPAAPQFPTVEIRSVRETKFQNWIWADNVWRINWPCLRVDLWTSGDLKGDETFGKAYFFDADKKLITSFDEIPAANHPNGSYGLPPILKARTNIDIYVPIDSKAKAGKWRSLLLVFGDPEKLMAEVYPKREGTTWKDFQFAERDKLLAQAFQADGLKKNQSSLLPPPSSFPAQTPSSLPGSAAGGNAFGAAAQKGARELKVKVMIPGADAFKVQNGAIWFEHLSLMRHGMPYDIVINDVPWKPDWTERVSSKYSEFPIPLAPFTGANVVVTQMSGRTPIKTEAPTDENGNTLSVQITDTPDGAGEYVFRIRW